MLRKILYGVAALAALAGVAALTLYLNPELAQHIFLKPSGPFDVATAPPAPDYADEAAWAALPNRGDMADVVPAGGTAKDAQATADVDVFYVHPTTYYENDGWNAAYDEPGNTMLFLESGVLRYQASTFNGAARVFAPRYRQATLYSFIGNGPDEAAALDFAYRDVARAFDNFIASRNRGRPFILAAHSQGSLHGMRLLQEKIAGTPLARRMVAAYLVGYAIPADMGLDGIGPCEGPSDTGCYLNWNSVTAAADGKGWTETSKVWLDGVLTEIAGRALACVNPITGSLGGSADASENLGTVVFVDSEIAMPAPLPRLTGAECDGGLLRVDPPADQEGLDVMVFDGDYHVHDYNLFYMNVREDVARRVEAFLTQ